ncbi:hypothetical protein MTO96_043324 [Rhipicephalus appendiculatus]
MGVKVNDTSKDRRLWQDANEMDLTLMTDKAFPTRIGNLVTRDSTPDLAFVKNVERAERSNTTVDFRSDHNVHETRFDVTWSKTRVHCHRLGSLSQAPQRRKCTRSQRPGRQLRRNQV